MGVPLSAFSMGLVKFSEIDLLSPTRPLRCRGGGGEAVRPLPGEGGGSMQMRFWRKQAEGGPVQFQFRNLVLFVF